MRKIVIYCVLLLIVGLCCSCGNRCNYRNVQLSLQLQKQVLKIGDTLSMSIEMQCGKCGSIALYQEPLDNFWVVSPAGKNIGGRDIQANNKAQYALKQLPVRMKLWAVVENVSGQIVIRFIPSCQSFPVSRGRVDLKVYYVPPRESLGWLDSDDEYPSTEVGFAIE